MAGLKGIRLQDIYGFNDSAYNSFLDENSDRLRLVSTESKIPLETIQLHAYINKLLRDKIGNEGYNANVGDKSLEDKISYYNSLFEEPSPLMPEESTNPIDTFSLYRNTELTDTESPDSIFNLLTGALLNSIEDRTDAEELAKSRGLNFNLELASNPDWINGDLVPSRTPAFGKRKGATLYYWFLWNTNQTGLTDIPEDFSALTAAYLYDSLFKPASVDDTEEQLHSRVREEEVEDYAKSIRAKFDANPKFTYLFFNQFENNLKDSIWKKYNIVGNTNDLPFTPNEIKDIMAKYYAKSYLLSQLDADKYVADEMLNKFASTQSFFDRQTKILPAMTLDFVGNTISVVGGILYLPQAIINASKKDTDIEGVNWITELLYYAYDNPIARYGNDVITTGTMNPKLLKLYKDAGYNITEFRRSAGNEYKFWNVNTYYDTLALSGFTVAGIFTGTAIGSVLGAMDNQLLGAAARKMALDTSKKVSQQLANAINKTGKAMVAGTTSLAVAGGEASMDALLTYDDVMSNYDSYIDQAILKDLDNALNNGLFDAYYELHRNPLYKELEDFYSTPAREGQYKFIDPQAIGLLEAYLTAEREAIYELFKLEFAANPKYDMQEAVRQSALRAAARNMLDETITVAFSELIFQNTLGKGIKAAKNEVSRKFTGSGNKFIATRTPEGLLLVSTKPISKARATMRGVKKGFIESLWEGIEEWEQNVDSRLLYDLADDYLTKYAANITDPEALNLLSMNYAESMDVINKSLGENVLSLESIYSFLLGAVSSGMGSPTLITRASPKVLLNRADRKAGRPVEKESPLRFFAEYMWRNPFFENIQDAQRDIERTTTEAADINKWLQEHPTVARMKDQNEIVAWMLSQRDAINNGDILSYRDSAFGLKVATLLMMERLSGSIKEKALSKKIDELTKININDAEAEGIIQHAVLVRKAGDSTQKDYGELTDEEKVEILNDVKQEAVKLKELQKDVVSTRNYFETRFGGFVSPETLDAFTYLKVAFKDYLNRINSITANATEAYNRSTNKLNGVNAALATSAEKNTIARWGSLENVKKERLRIAALLDQLKQNKFGIFSHTIRTLKRNLKTQLEEAKAAELVFKSIEESGDKSRGLITASEILALNPIERAYLLNDARAKLYSKELQLEIDLFKATEDISVDVLNDLQDAGRLLNKLNEFPKLLKELTSSERAARLFDRDVKLESARRTMEQVLLPAINAESLEAFDAAFTEVMNNPNYSEYERLVVPGILNRSKSKSYFKTYAENERARRNAENVIFLSKKFQELSKDQKDAFVLAYRRASRKHSGEPMIADYIYEEFGSQEYLEELTKLGMNTDKLNLTDPVFNQAVADILHETDNYNAAKAAIEKSRNDLRTSKKALTNPTTPGKKKTIFKVDNENRSTFNSVVNAVRDYLNGKISKSIKLTKQTFVDLMNLCSFGDEFITIDATVIPDSIIGDEVILTEKTIKNIKNQINLLLILKKLELGTSYAEDNLVKNLETLLSRLNVLSNTDIKDTIRTAILEIDPSLKDSITSKKETKKAMKQALKNEVRQYSTKEYKSMTKAEQDYSDKYKLDENLQEVKAIVNKREVELVLGYNDELVNAALLELSSDLAFNNDDLPLVLYVIIDKSEITDSLKNKLGIIDSGKDFYLGIIDSGKDFYYVPIGILANSRQDVLTEKYNNINAARQSAIDGAVDSNGFILNHHGNIHRLGGIKFVSDSLPQVTLPQPQSLTGYLETKYNGIYNDKNEVKQEVIDDFKLNVVSVTTEKVKDNDGEWVDVEGNYTIRATFTTKDGKLHLYFYPSKNPNWSSRKSFTQLAYLIYDASGEIKPMLLNVTSFNAEEIKDLLSTDKTKELVNALKKNEETGITSNNIKLVNAIRNAYFKLEETLRYALKPDLLKRAVLDKLGENVTKEITKFLNLSLTVEQKNSPYEIVFYIDKNDENKLNMYLRESGVTKLIPLATLDISEPIRGTRKNTYNEKLVRFLMDGFKNLILDENGELRLNDSGAPIVKPLINYQNLVKSQFIDNDIINALKYNMFTGIAYPTQSKVTGVEASETVDNSITSDDPETRALLALGHFIKDPTLPRDPESYNGAVAVTKFIADDSVQEEETVSELMALKFGTTVDTLFRLFFGGIYLLDSKREASILKEMPTFEQFDEAYRKYTTEHMVGVTRPNLTGLNETQLSTYYNMFTQIYRFISDRGEHIVTGEFRFIGNVTSSNNKTAKLIAEPDLITIDANGLYHIYDLKTFKYSENALSVFKGFRLSEIAVKGLSNATLHREKWNLQLALYKAVINDAIKGITVASIGIIPISLSYDTSGELSIEKHNMEGNFDSISRISQDGKKRTVVIDTQSQIAGTSTKMTRSYNDAILLDVAYDISKIGVNKTNANWHNPGIREAAQKLEDSKATGTIVSATADTTVVGLVHKDIDSASNKGILNDIDNLRPLTDNNNHDKTNCGPQSSRVRPRRRSAF